MPDQSSTLGAGESTALTRGCDCYVHLYGAIGDGCRAPRYDSDMTDAEWAVILVAMPMPMPAWLEGRGGRPEAHCHRAMLDALRYLVDNGVKWRNLPADYRWWRAVYDFFRRWRRHGCIRELYQRLRRTWREKQGREPEPGAGVIDSPSVDGSETCPAASRGYDGGKMRDGRRRHVLCDTGGRCWRSPSPPPTCTTPRPPPACSGSS